MALKFRKLYAFNSILQSGKPEDCKFIVVSLSVQPVLSLAARYELEPEDAIRRLAGYFRNLGADMILDMTVAEDFALLESAQEFVERYKSSKEGLQKQLPMLASSCPGKKKITRSKMNFSNRTSQKFIKL